jgi:hypothetical protein
MGRFAKLRDGLRQQGKVLFFFFPARECRVVMKEL